MPITPFHLGPGAALKAVAPAQVSFTVFAFSQFLIVLSVWPGRRASEWAIRLWNSRLSEAQARWLAVEPRIALRPAIAGAVLGAYSHVFIDSFMHADMEPFAPFAAGVAGIAVLYARRRLHQAQSQPTR